MNQATQSFKYTAVLMQGRPVHNGDYFSLKHPQMRPGQRAKLFLPFAALKGFDNEILSKEVPYTRRPDPDQDELWELNSRITQLCRLTSAGKEARRNHVTAEITVFVPCGDPHNEAYLSKGQCIPYTGIVRRTDPVMRRILLDQTEISFDDIIRIRILSAGKEKTAE